ncbi:MAG: hypothetical protein HZB68_02635 [Candidatus Aenigmarchaeota archaeon]|nr:hypothetical protein [Candidatus Aenigmarchaeota archaeon]
MKKGQFFLIASVVVVSFLSAIQTQLGSYSAANVASPAQISELFILNEAKDQVARAALRGDCESSAPIGNANLIELKNMSEKSAAIRGIYLNITYTDLCPRPVTAIISVKSERANAEETLIVN